MLNQMKCVRVFGLGIVASMSMLLSSCSDSIAPEEKKVEAVEEANFAYGNGVNLQPSYFYNGNVKVGWELMKTKTQIKTVRIEINPEAGGGEAVQVSNATRLIKEAHTNGYQVIGTYHPINLGDKSTVQDIRNAGAFWRRNYGKLSNNGTTPFIINLINEWGGHQITPEVYAKEVSDALANVYAAPVNSRDGGTGAYNKKVIIDAPGYGQETTTLVNSLSLSNMPAYRSRLVLSAHIYPAAYVFKRKGSPQGPMYDNDLAVMAGPKLPCIIGEYGTYSQGYTGNNNNLNGMVNYANANNWAVIAWAWCGDGTGKPGEGGAFSGQGMNMVRVPNNAGQNNSDGSFKAFNDPSAYQPSAYMNTMLSKLL